jgi:ribosomal protein L7/L12
MHKANKTYVPHTKELILNRLEMLTGLIEATQMSEPSKHNLFDNHHTTILDYREQITKDHYFSISTIMKDANRIWKLRKRIESGELDGDVEQLEMEDTIEDMLSRNEKISAIKFYRKYMEDVFKEKIGLKEAKDYVDSYQLVMKGRR